MRWQVVGSLGLLSVCMLASHLVWSELLVWRSLERRLSTVARTDTASPCLEAVPELRFEDRDVMHQSAAKYD
jgi:hypothetical protein